MKRGPGFPIRWLGVLLGTLFIITAVYFVYSSRGTILNVITFLVAGGGCLFYGLTGRTGRPLFGKEREDT
jgi:hypothetical protein